MSRWWTFKMYLPMIGVIALVPILLLIVVYFGNTHIDSIEALTCDELMESIRTSNPNYQYDVREWIAKECWK